MTHQLPAGDARLAAQAQILGRLLGRLLSWNAAAERPKEAAEATREAVRDVDRAQARLTLAEAIPTRNGRAE
jgi:hypothetical protein